MNIKHQELVARLKKALDNISGNPQTEAAVTLLFRDLVVSFEEIASDLKQTPDQETAAILKAMIKAASKTGSA
jgi:hypothetical protein